MAQDIEQAARAAIYGSWREKLALAREVRRNKEVSRWLEVGFSLKILEGELGDLEPQYRRWLRFIFREPFITRPYLCDDMAIRHATILLEDEFVAHFGKAVIFANQPIGIVGGAMNVEQ